MGYDGRMDQPRISLSMIVRDEQFFLANCLESVKGAVDEIVVVDTGSTDHSVEIARAYGAKIGHFEWNDRFDDARNAALSLCSGDWIISLDADERLVAHHWAKVREISKTAPMDCQGIFFTCLSGTPGPVDESPVLRMFRRQPWLRWEGRVHEEVGMTIQRNRGNLGQSQVCIVHDGYQAELVKSKNKWERNERLLLLENEERPGSGFTLYNLGHLYLVLAVQGRSEPDPEILAKAAGYFLDSLARSGPDNLYWTRLVGEAAICGIKQQGKTPAWPICPVSVLGQHPDPLARAS